MWALSALQSMNKREVKRLAARARTRANARASRPGPTLREALLHYHPCAGSYRSDCQRCRLEHAVPEMLALLEKLQRTLAWGMLRGVSKTSLVKQLRAEHILVTALLDRVAPIRG
jgi:hypothetical protein